MQWRRWAALAILTACGGTTGLENIDGGDAASLDATSLGIDTSVSANSPVGVDSAVGVDSQVGAESSAGIDVSVADGSGYDRTVPGRPPAGDTGVPPATNNDSGVPTPIGSDAGPDGGGPLPTTLQVLAAVTDGSLPPSDTGDADVVLPPCVACAMNEGCLDPTLMGGGCEMILDSGTPQMRYGGAFDGGDTCTTLGLGAGASETAICVQTLAQIFASKCGASGTLTPCLCGTVDTNSCTAGMATPNGPLYETYACDFGTANSGTINTDFPLQSFGAGMANSLVLCIHAYGSAPGPGGFDPDCCACLGGTLTGQSCSQP